MRMVLLAAGSLCGSPSGAATLPAGFGEAIVFTGLTQPTAIKFARDGRVFVAEKSGLIKVFDGLTDTTPTVFADLRTPVHNFWDRGMLGLELHPAFPTTPYVYVLYTLDAPIGGTPPRWGTAGATTDGCPNPPGATGDGCVVGARLSRLTASGNAMTGPEHVFVEDWCQQYPSHSIGSLAFGPDGALYVSGGDGASFNFADYGQDGSPVNPCGDPPVPLGGQQTPPTAEGGALRSQDVETSGDPVTMDGAVLRLDPETGAAMPDNPLVGGPTTDDDRIIAYGLRNPFRMTVRPGSGEIWVGDVGWTAWEEINRIPSPTDPVVENFGWPCYEGVGRQGGYDGANLDICESLYSRPGAVAAPFYTYNHSAKVVAGETCPTGSSAIAGLAFYEGGDYPPEYQGALFFADYNRDCIWAMLPGANGDPDPNNRVTFVAGAANPVQLTVGPGGDVFYPDFDGGTIRRIQFHGPTAVATADTTGGGVPLDVQFNASGSRDPDPADVLTYAWDLDGDGQLDDSSDVAPTFTYTAAGSYTVRLRVTDPQGLSDQAILTINVSNSAPTATIATPTPLLTWQVGDRISFSGSATDPEQGVLPASALTWTLVMQHCPSDCHEHTIQSFEGVATGSFSAPDHEYPSYLQLRLTARDAGGLGGTDRVDLQPQTVTLSFASSPTGLQLTVGAATQAAPFGRTVIVGSANSVSAPSPQTSSGTEYAFSSWSDGGEASHTIVAPATATAYVATFTPTQTVPPSLSIGDASTTEGTGASTGLLLVVSLSAASAVPVRVSYSTGGGNATPNVDYLVTSGTLEIPPGSTTGTIPATVVGDNLKEKTETFVVTLSNPANATILDGSATVRIVDDDGRKRRR
jgi:glucose/arabinose dehydrogenase